MESSTSTLPPVRGGRVSRSLGRLVEVGPPLAGRPRFEEWGELAIWLSVLAVAALTPAHDALGRANAPLMGAIERWTGGGVCWFKRLSGIDCAGCGLTRAFVQILHGDLVEAVRLHPLAPVIFGWVVLRAVGAGSAVLLRRRVESAIPWPVAWKLYGATFAVYLGLGVFRIVSALAQLA